VKKIPTMFERDWDSDKSRVVDRPHKDCDWVFAGEGVATRKLDGTSCLVRSGRLFKRRELREGDVAPRDFELATLDKETGKRVGWMPCDSSPADRWHMEAFGDGSGFADGTYELLGPKVQSNPERVTKHILVPHTSAETYADAPRNFDGLKAWLAGRDIEGLVWHNPDGRMAKIKLRDFGLRRAKQ
jgi:uncharacterized protein DUF5565